MMRRLLKLIRGERGVTALEFALLAPAFCTFIVAIGNFGILFFAHSGLSAAVSEGARLATIDPRPSADQVAARINERKYGLNSADVVGPTVTFVEPTGGRPHFDIEMHYDVKLKLVFFDWPPYRISERRTVYVYSNLSRPTPTTSPTGTPTTTPTTTPSTTPTEEPCWHKNDKKCD